ncbi:unnamed protein product [Angiostrongylus costaricensis]|uniref:Integrase n=1 Tax=Angiostrongylus costaricensis TaxID=334426 RepID=A0A0R3PN72_ANGCS|nr:unnamed protein product [Angiostrongylus costaricensis]
MHYPEIDNGDKLANPSGFLHTRNEIVADRWKAIRVGYIIDVVAKHLSKVTELPRITNAARSGKMDFFKKTLLADSEIPHHSGVDRAQLKQETRLEENTVNQEAHKAH